jgi:hypothetical protein
MPFQFAGYQTRTNRFQAETEAPLEDVLGATADQTLTELPVNSIYRFAKLAYAQNAPERVDADTARQRIKDAGLEGRLKVPDNGIATEALNILMDRKHEEVKRQEILSRAPSGIGPGAAKLGTSLVTGMMDPLNVGLAFVPVVGEARYMRYLAQARGVFGRAALRAGVGAVEGATGAAIAEPFVYTAKTQEQADYDYQDSLLNVAFGGVFGGGLHAVSGGLGDAVGKLRGTDRETMLRTAVAQAVQGQEVHLEPVTPQEFNSKIPRDPSLSDAQREIENNLASKVEGDTNSAIREYATHPDAEGGKVLNTDVARELSPEYRADRTQSAAVHEPASWIVKEMYARKLKEAAGAGERELVLFTAGGTGAGKSTGMKLLGNLKEESQIVYDTNMSDLRGAVTKIEQALAANKTAHILYTWRDPVDALVHGALPRAERMGRTVPITEHAKTHVGAAKVIKELAQKYEGNPRVALQVIDNSHGKNGARLGSIDQIPDLAYDSVLGDLNAALEAERKAGRISEATYRGTAGLQGRTGSPGVDEASGAASYRQSQQERARRSIEDPADVTADPSASKAADEQIAATPKETDPIADQEAAITEEIAKLEEELRVAGIERAPELDEFDEAIKLADDYGKAARAAILCGARH